MVRRDDPWVLASRLDRLTVRIEQACRARPETFAEQATQTGMDRPEAVALLAASVECSGVALHNLGRDLRCEAVSLSEGGDGGWLTPP